MECYVAYLLGEDEDGPHELSIDMFPEDGRLRVGEDGVTPFTEDAPLRNRKFADSPLEGNGFELPVPRRGKLLKPQYHSFFAGTRADVCMEPNAASYTGLIGGRPSLLSRKSRQAGRASRWRLLEAR